MTIAELTQRQRSLKKAMDETQPGTEQWKRLSDELKTTSSRLVEIKIPVPGPPGLLAEIGRKTATGATLFPYLSTYPTEAGHYEFAG